MCARNAHTNSGQQWVIKQLTLDKWTVVVSAGPGPSLCPAERLRLKTAQAELVWMTSAPIHVEPARQNKQVATPGTDQRENRQVREYPAQLCSHVHLDLF